MRNIRIMTGLVFVVLLTLVFTAGASAQETVAIPLNDLKQLQKVAAEREYYKSAYEDEKRKSAEWELSAGDWKRLYLSEKDRADRVQGGRVEELTKANAGYKDQADRDQRRLGEQAATVASLRSQRKWWFVAGAAVGAAAGAWLGHKVASTNINIPGFPDPNRPVPNRFAINLRF